MLLTTALVLGHGQISRAADQQPASKPPARRYFIAKMWMHDFCNSMEEVTRHVDKLHEMGFKYLAVYLPWKGVEPREGEFEFDWLDQRLDYAVQKDFQLVLKIDMFYSMPEWFPDSLVMCMEDGKPFTFSWPPGSLEPNLRKFAEAGTGRALCFSSAAARRYAGRAFYQLARHYEHRYPGKMLCYQPWWANCAEGEYPTWGRLDHSPHAVAGFREWLKGKHGELETLNRRWRRKFQSWEEVTIKNAYRPEWMAYRSYALKQMYDEAADAVHRADPNARMCADFGSIWDRGAPRRGSIDAAYIAQNLDWLKNNDREPYDHCFSTDILRSAAKGRLLIQNEIGGANRGCKTNAGAVTLARESFEHGADAVSMAATWTFCEDMYDPQWTFFDEVLKMGEKPKTVVEPVKKAIYVSTWAMYEKDVGAGQLALELYKRLSNNGRHALDIITDGVFVSDPDWLQRYSQGIYIPQGCKIISDEAFTILSECIVPLYPQDAEVGTLNEYSRRRPTGRLAYLRHLKITTCCH